MLDYVPVASRSGRSIAVIALAVLVCLGVVCTFGFTNFEDFALITGNPNFNPATLHGLWNHWRAPHIFLYIPVTYTLWWVLARFGRTSAPDETGATLNPWLFHSANLLLHLACCILIFLLLKRLLRGRPRTEGPALFGALLFGLHPLEVEAVAWTTGTKDVLAGAFSFAAILLYVAFAQDSAASPRRRRLRYACGALCLVLAMLSKPAACVVPVMAGIIDYLILHRPIGAVIKSIVPWLILTIPILAITRIVQPASGIFNLPPIQRPLVAADALAFYLWKLIWPFNLTIDYGRSPASIVASGAIYWTWVFPLILAAVIVAVRKRWLWASGLLFVVGLLPVLGLTTFLYQRYSTVADRFVYLSMLGVAVAGAFAVSARWTRPVAIGCGMLLALLGARSTNQALTWRNRITLYSHAIKVNPTSASSHNMLGVGYEYAGRMDLAGEEYRRAVDLDGSEPAYHRNLALYLEQQGQLEAALAQWKQAANEISPDLRLRAADLQEAGVVLLRLGRPAEALDYLQRAYALVQNKKIEQWIIRAKAQLAHGSTQSSSAAASQH